MRQLTFNEFDRFIAAKPVAAIHIDAEWDARYRELTRSKMLEAEQAIGESASLAEIDCDQEPTLAKSIGVGNVPAVAYYRNGELVAVLMGMKQNVRARLERLLRGEAIGRDDGLNGYIPGERH
jgi:thioredoxin-like negative regulator of GroEL